MDDCVFCRIAARQIPAAIVVEEPGLVAFRDANPQAPTHMLIIPTTHIPKLSDVTSEAQAQVLARAVLLANRLAQQAGIAQSGYRVVVNCGPHAGQSVDHLHLHLLGGRAMRWPPG